MIAPCIGATRRSGTAAVECGVVLMFVMVPLMLGVWEVGRLIFCQQVIVNALREGARLAAQGKTVNSSGAPTNIHIQTGTPNVKEIVFFALRTGGLPELDRSYVFANTTFQFLPPFIGPTPTEPWNASKSQPFRIALTVDWSRVRWLPIGILNPTDLYYQVDWRILVDDPFSVSTDMPYWNLP